MAEHVYIKLLSQCLDIPTFKLLSIQFQYMYMHKLTIQLIEMIIQLIDLTNLII